MKKVIDHIRRSIRKPQETAVKKPKAEVEAKPAVKPRFVFQKPAVPAEAPLPASATANPAPETGPAPMGPANAKLESSSDLTLVHH